MDRERQIRSPEGESQNRSLSERIETIRELSSVRDARHEDLLRVIAKSDKSPRHLLDAWVRLQSAQGDVDRLVAAEVRARL